MSQSGTAGARVKINGTEVGTDELHAVTVEMDVNQPDMATATINNGDVQKAYSKNINIGDSLEVNIAEAEGGNPVALFKGEVVGIEPFWDTGGETKVIVRALNKFHRLSHGRKSKTFSKKTDKQIAEEVAQAHGLTLQYSGNVDITHDHVYQHNCSDFDFLLARAARINYEVVVDDTKLIFRQRDLSNDSGIELPFGNRDDGAGEQSLQRFQARMTSAGQVTKVTVRGWDPAQHKEIIGESKGLAKALGGTEGGAAVKKGFNNEPVHFDADVPVSSKAEADAIAQAKLEDFALGHIVAEAKCKGSPTLKPGLVVKVTTIEGRSEPDERFRGQYYISGATHQYSNAGGAAEGGYRTFLKLKRNASGQ